MAIISSLQSELNSLGFLAIRRKKEIQVQIQSAESALSNIDTVDKVTSKYDRLMKELNQREEDEIRQAERLLRSNYPLPAQ